MLELIVETLDSLLIPALSGFGLAFALLVVVGIARQFLFIGRPNEMLIFFGRGSETQLLMGGGRRWRIPVLEQVERMTLNTLPIDIQVINAYSKGGIALNVHAVANVKVSNDPKIVGNAIERFLGRDRSELQRVAKETLEGHLRGVLATLTPEEINEDRLKFASALVNEAEEDFEKLGLHLDTLKVQAVSDEVNYLESIGRERIAEVIRDAEIAESNAKTDAERSEADARKVGDVAVQDSQAAIIQKRNDLRRLRADLEAKARSEDEKAAAAAEQARAESEKELQEIRTGLEELRLQADVVLPAQAEQVAQALRARGAAASIEANGKAMAAVLQMMTDAWLKAGPDAKDIFLIQQLEEVLKTVVDQVNSLSIREITVLDDGSGDALPRHVASYPAMVRQVLEELEASTGVDVTGILSGSRTAPEVN